MLGKRAGRSSSEASSTTSTCLGRGSPLLAISRRLVQEVPANVDEALIRRSLEFTGASTQLRGGMYSVTPLDGASNRGRDAETSPFESSEDHHSKSCWEKCGAEDNRGNAGGGWGGGG